MTKNPYSDTTRHPRSRWCGAMSSVTLDNGNEINVICTRFADHLTHPNSKNPLQHFDEVRRRHWYDEPTEPCAPSPE